MRLYIKYIILLLYNMQAFNSTTSIKSIRTCKTCKNFIKPKLFLDISNGQCKLYSNIDLVSGEIRYKTASNVRNYEKCGPDGLLHSDNDNITTS